jgi:glucose-1-phosphate adenylyltransferase
MDLLIEDNNLCLHDEEWKIHSVNYSSPAQYIGASAEIKNSIVAEGCFIEGEISNSVIFQGVHVGKNSSIIDSVIMPNVRIGDNVIINKAIVGSDAIIRRESKVGSGEEIEVVGVKEEVESSSFVEACTTI